MDLETAADIALPPKLINEDKMKATPSIDPAAFSLSEYIFKSANSIFSCTVNVFLDCSRNIRSIMRGGTNSEKTENMEQFDDVVHTILTARLRHAAARGRF